MNVPGTAFLRKQKCKLPHH